MRNKIILFIAFAIMLSSCGNSIITVSDKSQQYSIYINNQYKGINEVRIQRSGLPQHRLVEVKDRSGNLVGKEKIKRGVNVLKLIAGIYFWPLLVFGCEYDKNIEIYINKSEKEGSPWDADKNKKEWD